MNAKFNLKDARAEKTKLMLIIREGHNKKIKIYTDIEVSPKNWDNTAQNFKRTHPYYKLDSERLLKWKTSAAEAIRESDIAGEELEDVKLRILSKLDKEATTERSDEKSKFLPYYERWITTETTKRTVTRQMRYSLNLFREFVGDSDPCFDNITIKFIENFIEWMAKKGLKANTRGSHIKRIKTAMGEAFDAGLHNSREFEKFRVEKEQVENIYLSEEEIRKIEELPLSGRKERSRDLFIIGCHTAMRFSDCIRLKPDDIKDGIIKQKQVKTGNMVSIPCHPKVAEIIRKYHGAPQVCDVLLNRDIKEICWMAGIRDKVGIRRHGDKETTYYEKWQLVSSHTARRSAATNMYKAGIPTIAIMKITGHKSERVFMDYIKVSGEENARMLKKNPFFN